MKMPRLTRSIFLLYLISIVSCGGDPDQEFQPREALPAPKSIAPVTVIESEVGLFRHADAGSVQAHLGSLQLGRSSESDVVAFFGKPEDTTYLHQLASLNAGFIQDGSKGVVVTRYPSQNLSFVFLGKNLYSITVTREDVSIGGVRFGDTLDSIKATLEKSQIREDGAWSNFRLAPLRTGEAISDIDSEDWWLEYENEGFRIGFKPDSSAAKYPKKLAEPMIVTKLQVFDSRIRFISKVER
jgi:hypothetical protein